MELGAFSISLAVKDIQASKDFYEKLGFTGFMRRCSQNWLIMKNGDHVIGLFQGMFEKNMLTFNPGWDQNASKLATVHRRARAAAPAEGAGRDVADRGGRSHHRPGELHGGRPGRQPDPGRPARLSGGAGASSNIAGRQCRSCALT